MREVKRFDGVSQVSRGIHGDSSASAGTRDIVAACFGMSARQRDTADFQPLGAGTTGSRTITSDRTAIQQIRRFLFLSNVSRRIYDEYLVDGIRHVSSFLLLDLLGATQWHPNWLGYVSSDHTQC